MCPPTCKSQLVTWLSEIVTLFSTDSARAEVKRCWEATKLHNAWERPYPQVQACGRLQTSFLNLSVDDIATNLEQSAPDVTAAYDGAGFMQPLSADVSPRALGDLAAIVFSA
eukprot:scaffold273113_cov43-Tisochrysis_lutea.AAC.1